MPAYHETKIHGTRDFPYAVYRAILPKFFNSFPLHWHDEMEIIYVADGKIIVSVESRELRLSRGEIALIHPQTIHSIRRFNDETTTYYNILFRFSLLESEGDDVCRTKYFEPIYSRSLIMPEYLSSDNPLCQKLSPLLDALIECAPQISSDNELLIKSGLFEIMHHIKSNCLSVEGKKETKGRFYEELKPTLVYIEENYPERISVAEAAAMSNFSPSYFSKLFRALTGSSFNQYLKNYRLERAAEKLGNQMARVSDAAVSCGFENLSYFTRAFRQKYGVSPKEFRDSAGAIL